MLYDGSTFKHDSHSFKVRFPADDSADLPWENQELYGTVSGWTRSAKGPGEMILASDRGSHRIYDFQAAMQAAKKIMREYPDESGLSDGQRAHAAVMAEFDYLRRFCSDQWSYVGVVVEMLDDDDDAIGEDITASLWGIESDASEYLEQTAHELAGEIIAGLLSTLAA